MFTSFLKRNLELPLAQSPFQSIYEKSIKEIRYKLEMHFIYITTSKPKQGLCCIKQHKTEKYMFSCTVTQGRYSFETV
jgi:hypothetical protein